MSALIHKNSEEYRAIGPVTGTVACGLRVDLFLARYYPFHSRSGWKEACRRRELLVDGRPVRASHRLRGGEQLSIYHPLTAEPEVDDRIAVLGEMNGVIAVYKPGNLPMHESGEFRRRTFAAMLAAQCGSDWHPVHRLDRETSGILICAACPKLRMSLSKLFEVQQVDKRYLAIVQGVVPWTEQSLIGALAPDPTASRPRYLVDNTMGLPAHSDCLVLERTTAATLVEVRPRTGRTNQIRVHLAWAGHPIVGDKVYHPDPEVYAAYHLDGDSAQVRQLAGFSRHALHATSVRFAHPNGGEEFVANSPLPSDLHKLWHDFQNRSE